MFFLNFLKIKKIRFLIWDVDRTLWSSTKLAKIIKEEFIIYLKKFIKRSKKEVFNLFNTESKKWESWSKTVSFLTGIEEERIILDIERKINKYKYLKKDKKLLEVFNKLKQYRHLILTNGSHKNTLLSLQSLGFPLNAINDSFFELYPFEKIFSIEKTCAAKPKKEAFLKILEYTNMLPENHLIIGDSFELDIKPAKKLGMRTCLVGKINNNSDFSVLEVYNIPLIFSLQEKFNYFFKKIIPL
ncbi:MAG: HAD family hydrolase [Microgenomates group bacterium]